MIPTERIDEALDLIASEVLHAEKPIALSSFGKDSLVLLDLCLSVRPMPVLMFAQEPHRFPDKYKHAYGIIEYFKLEAFTLPPRAVAHVQDGDYFDIFHTFGGDTTGPLVMAMGCKPMKAERSEADPFVCAVDMMLQPMAEHVNYPWDVTFHGHKQTDDVKLARKTTIVTPAVDSGSTRLVLPLWNWTDDEVRSYVKMRNLPYDAERYDQHNEAVNPDVFDTCFACLDTRKRGEKVFCPILQSEINNRAQTDEWHAKQKLAVLGAAQYANFELVNPVDEATTRKFLDSEETWALFTIKKRIFNDLVYVVIDNLKDISRMPDGMKQLREEWIKLELRCAEAGIVGWLARADKSNVRMQRCILSTGCKPYAEDESAIWYKKMIDPECTVFPSLREMVAQAIQVKHG